MKNTLRLFLITGSSIVIIGIFGFFLIRRVSSSANSTTTVTGVPYALSNAASSTISSTTKQALLASTSTIPKSVTRPTIKPTVPLPSAPIATSTTPTVATTTMTTATTSPSSSFSVSPNNDPANITINAQAIVGILCYYNDTYTNENTGKSVYEANDEEVRGSGVIINSRGNILTNRHIIQQPESYTSIDDSNGNSVPVSITYQLDHCDVGQLPQGATLPTVSEIESFNPYIQIPVLGYTAQPVYISRTQGLSNVEVQYADFAILGITGISSSGPTFGVTSVPSSFPYITFLPIQNYPDIVNSQVITYGFPGDVTAGQGNFFQTLTMTGSVGTVSNIYYGDQYYSDTPLNISTDLAIAHGRSGSPLFWHGYDVGIVTFFIGENQTDSGSVASDAVLKALKGTNYIPGD